MMMEDIIIPAGTVPDQAHLIVDGSNLAHRSFHSRPEGLTSPDGVPSNAVLGFAVSLIGLLAQYHPKSLVVAWDPPVNPRKEQYAGYKADRPEMNPNLKAQWEPLKELVSVLGGYNWLVDGYEADDLMASWSQRVDKPQIIFTGDKDLLTLVCEGVDVLRPVGGGGHERVGPNYVEQKYGVKAEQFSTYLALIGDSSDGWPGVAGIGPVAAKKILNQYETLDHLYENIDSFENKRYQKLFIEGRDMAYLGLDITNLKYDLELPDGWNIVNYDTRAAIEWLKRWGLTTVLNRLESLEYVWHSGLNKNQ